MTTSWSPSRAIRSAVEFGAAGELAARLVGEDSLAADRCHPFGYQEVPRSAADRQHHRREHKRSLRHIGYVERPREWVMAPVPVDEIFAQPRESISLRPDETLDLDPSNERVRGFYHEAEIRSFADLQTLDLIPRRLDENRVREAINADDDEVLAAAMRRAGNGDRDCGCSSEDGGTTRSSKLAYSDDLRSMYSAMRRRYNPRLARILTENTGVFHNYDDIAPAVVTHWSKNWWSTPAMLLQLWLFMDVEVGANSTLVLGKSAKGLYCGDLRIHVGGRLVVKGSAVKIRCASATGNIP